MAERTPKKRRKTLPSEMKLLEGAERSLLTEEDVEWNSEEMRTSELWLIQVPRDLDITSLHNHRLELKDTEEIDLQNTQGKKKYSITSHPVQKKSKMDLPLALLPSCKAGRLAAGPCFDGQACVSQSVNVPPVHLPPLEPGTNKIHEVPEGLQQRWKPFGWKTPVNKPLPKTKHKKKSRKSQPTK